MRLIKIVDFRDYDSSYPRITRSAVRGIIVIRGKLLLVHSEKYGEYKFPGGGVEENESHTDTLIREVKEETGCGVLFGSIHEYGKMIELRRDRFEERIFEHSSFYYLCRVSEDFGALGLDEYERERGFHPVIVSVDEAIAGNEGLMHKRDEVPWATRELVMLRHLKENLAGLKTTTDPK